MAINWTTLTAAKSTSGSIANWVNRSDLPTTNILIEAEAWIYQYLRVREMVTDEAVTIAEDASSKALSTLSGTFLDPVHFIPYEWGTELLYVNEANFKPGRTSAGALYEGTPSYWTIINATMHVDVLCNAAFSGRMMYYAQPAALSVSNETNFLTVRYPRLLRQACLIMAYEHMKDDQRAQQYTVMAMGSIEEANRTNEMFRRGQQMPAW